MKTSSFHLNLLRTNEVLSSSPVRLRIMLPVGALLACAGLLVWWGILFTQIFIAKTQSHSIEEDLAAKNSAHSEAIQKRDLARELKLQLEQLEYYRTGSPFLYPARYVASCLMNIERALPLAARKSG